ncbi:hypothetical protein DL95DRAFT_462245 [Leptodontidium sp. 2 PMI_412]|nr:hypothetical protein DL95DRAFT_462245 [Leptodontidium sp. 2 PMI_412]
MAAKQNPTAQDHPQQDAQGSEKVSIIGLATTVRNGLLRAFSFGLQEPDPDSLEQWLQTDPSQEHYFFLRDYKRMKLSPGKEIVDSLTKYYVFSAVASEALANTGEDNHETDHSTKSNITLSQALDDFYSNLRTSSNPSLRICVLSLKLPDSLRSGLVKFRDKVFCSIEHLNAKYDVPSRSILSLVQKEWAPSLDRSKAWIEDPFSKKSSLGQRPFILPSKVTNLRQFHLLNESTQGSTMKFTWVSSPPFYRGDFYEYIWQRQNQRPPQDTIVFSTSETNGSGMKNIFITVDSEIESANGTRCSGIMHVFDRHFRTVLPLLTGDRVLCNMESSYLGALFAILMVLAQSTNDYINSVSQIISKLSYEGRRRPSGSKLHYLSHLEDSRKLATGSVQDALILLAEIKDLITNSTSEKQLRVKLSDIEGDMEFLKVKLEDVEKQTVALQAMLKEKLDLRQIRRTYILTVLAAIYLPFSLMTKNKPTKELSPRIAVRDITLSPSNASTFSTEQTSAIVSAIQGSGSHLWTLQSYWYTAVPVTITTIIVPMLIGIIFRSVSRFAFYYRGYWRLIVITGILAFVATSDIFMNLLSLPYANIWLITMMVLLGLPAVILVCRAFMMKKHRLIWCGFAVSVAIYPPIWRYNYDPFSTYISITIPFAYLFLVWFRHYFRDCFLRYRAYRRRHPWSQNSSTVAVDLGIAEEGQIKPPQNVHDHESTPRSSRTVKEAEETLAAGALPTQNPQGSAIARNSGNASDSGSLTRARSTPHQPPEGADL